MSSSIENITSLPSNHNKKAVLFFWAPWHDSSKPGSQMDVVCQSLASSTQLIAFYKIEAEVVPELSQKYSISVVPTFILLNTDQTVFRKVEGAEPAQLTQAVSALLQNTTTTTTTTASADNNNIDNDEKKQQEQQRLNDRIKALIKSNKVMLFMKGSPTSPKCGFSREIVSILDQANIKDYGSFDILTDPEIRQGVKTYSDWPTYPQLYVNEEFVGGLDIMKEMLADCSSPTELAASLGIEQEEESALSLDQRLYNLTHQSKCMLFMKGCPSTPKCGFSRQIVELLNSHSITFDTFDILQDDIVRQGLKKYSDWPTYPQLYVDGELIGGLDIVREMSESGDLMDMM